MASPLGRLFGKSPITPIQQHMQLAQDCVQLLCELLAATADGEAARRGDIRPLVAEAAAKGRSLRRDIREHLPRGLMLAIPRNDLLALLDIQHAIVEGVQAQARLLCVRGLSVDAEIAAPLAGLCDHLAEAAGHALAAIRELDEMLEVAFTHKESGPVDAALGALRSRVERCDEQQTEFLEAIARREGDLPPVDAVMLYRLGEGLSDIILRCQEVGEQLELLLAR